ncbi:hypothetical protein HNQ34_000403 [Anoxybacillus tepidamans]|uniref:Uncharacterized protein n=1 Tax=Anoxybacteroides tepidamans TaxID=265948 RepID=A0A7W8INW5_9BACL|nr:hypothetical protein [Anoxybacillus tepidamans]
MLTFVELFETYRSLWSNRPLIKDEAFTEEAVNRSVMGQ